MSIFDDILKGLPVNSLVREKVAELEAKYAATETENAILKDDLRNANLQIAKLEKQIEKFTHKDDLDETDVKILTSIADPNHGSSADALARHLQLHVERLALHLDKLVQGEYLRAQVILRHYNRHSLTQKS